jgi:ubiquinone/menaquinone biosynthesis C-methylase UbiE
MARPISRFDADSVRRAWDEAADAYAEAQRSGRDHYRYAFFGPAQVEMCGEVRDLRVLDLGCGSGYFAREMAARGAHVIGVDISPNMIDQARQEESIRPLGIEYRVLDAASVGDRFQANSFDLVTSCLALQDMPEIPRVIAATHGLLSSNGRLVASISHPCTNPPHREWARKPDGGKAWLCIDRYFESGAFEDDWIRWSYPFAIPYAHATLTEWFGWFREAGFALRGFLEPRPTEAALLTNPDLSDAARVPYYVLFDWEKTEG